MLDLPTQHCNILGYHLFNLQIMHMKVSVLLPTYNRAMPINGVPLIERSIQSFLKQDYENSELIILDDLSTDNTKQILKKFEGHSRISIFYSDNNKKPPNNQNWLWAKATGELVCQLHDDDEMTPNGLSLRVAEFKRDRSIQVVYGGWHTQNLAGSHSGTYQGQMPDASRILKEEYINFTTLMYVRNLPFRFDSELRYYFDWLFKIRCLNECKASYVPEPVMIHTVHHGQETARCRQEKANEPQEIIMRAKLTELGYE